MDKVGYERGLIRYDTQSGMEGNRARILRPRTVLYGSLLAVVMTGFVISLSLRVPVSLDALRDRTSLYRVIDGNQVENVYTLKIANRSESPRRFQIEVAGLPGLALEMEIPELDLAGGELREFPVRVRAPMGTLPVGAGFNIKISVTAVEDPRVSASTQSRFLAPVAR